jgi:3D-(3,5/4)-trihydroxycyclohexane-1,2-dione acylhydrolase (decyclizing)
MSMHGLKISLLMKEYLRLSRVMSMNKIRLTMAQALVKFLDNQYVLFDNKEYKFVNGIYAIFGHGNVGGVGEALENLEHNLNFYQGHNEQAMANAAIAYAKQKNRLGIIACTSSIGPGALNMVTAAGTATTNRLPLLLLPGDNFASRQPDPVLQQLEQPYDYSLTVNDCFKPVSKYWDRIQRPEQLMIACINAFRVLTDPVDTGAVVLCLPQDTQCEAYDYPEEFFAKRVYKINNHYYCDDNELSCITEELLAAKKPLIISGGGVKYANAYQELENFVNKYKIPVVETQAGKSSLLWSNELNMGGVGVLGSKAGNILAKEADLILALGTRLNDFTTSSKTAFNNNTKIYNININKLDSYKASSYQNNNVSIMSDAKLFLSKLDIDLEICLENNRQSNANGNNWCVSEDYYQYCQSLKNRWQQELNSITCNNKEDNRTEQYGLVSQAQIIGELNKFVSDTDIVVGAAGSLPGDMQRLWQVKGLNTYHLEYAFSCMGYEVSGGLGVKLAEPEKEVYVLVGDGSFLMLHSELLTSLQEDIKINIILFDNSGYQCINNLQCSTGSRGYGNQFRYRDNQLNKLSGENIHVDFAQYAGGLGVKTFKANTIDQFKASLIEAKKSRVSTLIDIKVDPNSMSQGYECWWRFDPAVISNNKHVEQASLSVKEKLKQAKEY